MGADNLALCNGLNALLPSSWLAKSNAFAAGATLFDEFNASSFKGVSYSRFVGERDWNFTLNYLNAADRCYPNLGFLGQIEGCPPEHCPSCAHLSARDFSFH